MTAVDDISVRILIEGRVQGVWYRGWIVDLARAKGLSGWVRNRRDGSVEALFTGPAEAVRQIIDACWDGPPSSGVTSISEFPANEAHDSGFFQLPTE